MYVLYISTIFRQRTGINNNEATSQHRELRSQLSERSAWVFFTSSANLSTAKMLKTGPTDYRTYPRRLESLTVCGCHSKGSSFSSVILRPWEFARSGAWTLDLHHGSPTWANQVRYILYYDLNFRGGRTLRDSRELNLPRNKTAVNQSTFQYTTGKEWKYLSKELRTCEMLGTFQIKLFNFVIGFR